MSDFLTNLVGRSLGVLPVVQPRVPSIYEPYRRDRGLLGARPGVPMQDESSESAVETVQEGKTDTIPVNHRDKKLRPQVKSPGTRMEQPAEEEVKMQPTEGVEPPAPARPALASLSPRMSTGPETIATSQIPSRHDPRTESTALPILSPTSFEPALPAAIPRPDGGKLIAHPPVSLRRETPKDIRPLTESQGDIKPGPVHHPRSAEMNTETSISRMEFRQPATLRAMAEPSVIAHQEPPIASSAHLPVAPSLVAQQAFHATSTVRPPLPSRAGGAKSPEAFPLSSPPTPAVQVSIGRVEVRAVFPEPATRRAPAPRSRSTLSLDDYLNQRNRGKR
jgi:hypothetical protein